MPPAKQPRSIRAIARYVRYLVNRKNAKPFTDDLMKFPAFPRAYRTLNRAPGFRKVKWPGFLRQAAGMEPLRSEGRFLIPKYLSQEWAKKFIKDRIAETQRIERRFGTAHLFAWTDPKWWKQQKGYATAYRFIEKKHFDGYADWQDYLRHEIRVSFPETINTPKRKRKKRRAD